MAKPKRKSRRTEKKKSKEWYTVVAPQEFDSKELGEVLATDEGKVMHRIIPVSLRDMTGKMSQANIYTTLNFRIKDVKGKTAYTELIGHNLSPGYIRTLVRRRRTILHTIRDLPTSDDRNVRVKLLAVTRERISETMKKNLREIIEKQLSEASGEYDYYSLMQEIIHGRLASRIFNQLRQVTPMSRVEFRRTELHEDLE